MYYFFSFSLSWETSGACAPCVWEMKGAELRRISRPATERLERPDIAVRPHFASNCHGQLRLPFAINGGCSQTPISDPVKGLLIWRVKRSLKLLPLFYFGSHMHTVFQPHLFPNGGKQANPWLESLKGLTSSRLDNRNAVNDPVLSREGSRSSEASGHKSLWLPALPPNYKTQKKFTIK